MDLRLKTAKQFQTALRPFSCPRGCEVALLQANWDHIRGEMNRLLAVGTAFKVQDQLKVDAGKAVSDDRDDHPILCQRRKRGNERSCFLLLQAWCIKCEGVASFKAETSVS